jgi:tetratricopeptide (TPR) repeat protein
MDNSTHHTDELLVRYLDGDLPEETRKTFEQRLDSEPILRVQLEDLRQAKEAIRYYGLKDRVKTIHTEIHKESTAPVKQISITRKIIRYSISIAAGIILIVVGITGYNFYRLTPSRVLADQHTDYALPVTRGTDIRPSGLEKAFREKKYAAVVSARSRAKSPEEKMFVGVSYLKLKNYAPAIDYFKQVFEDKSSPVNKSRVEAAEYYLAMAYIGNKDYDFALAHLHSIQANPSHLYHENVSNKLIRRVKLLKWR